MWSVHTLIRRLEPSIAYLGHHEEQWLSWRVRRSEFTFRNLIQNIKEPTCSAETRTAGATSDASEPNEACNLADTQSMAPGAAMFDDALEG